MMVRYKQLDFTKLSFILCVTNLPCFGAECVGSQTCMLFLLAVDFNLAINTPLLVFL